MEPARRRVVRTVVAALDGDPELRVDRPDLLHVSCVGSTGRRPQSGRLERLAYVVQLSELAEGQLGHAVADMRPMLDESFGQ
ncbi:hypothetical protein GCM10029976_009750 [Kribbella albertanoniae]